MLLMIKKRSIVPPFLNKIIFVVILFFINSRRTAIGFLIQNNYYKSAATTTTTTIIRKCDSFVLSVRRRRKIHNNNVDIVVDNDDGDGGDTFDTLSELLLQLSTVNDVHNTTSTTVKSSSEQKLQKVARQKEILLSRFDDDNNNKSLPSFSSSSSNLNLDLNIHRTYVAKSQISSAGRGLFACNDYPKGTLLTCYPGDALVDLTTGNITWGSHTTQKQSQHSSISSTTDDNAGVDVPEEEEINHDYMLRAIHEDWGIVALPELYDNDNDDNNNDPSDSSSASASYLGHFANDGVISPPLCESELAMYVIESNDISNAMHQECQGCHMVTIATKSIKAGDEIFVTYGPEYWSEQPSFGDTKILPSSSSSAGGGKGFG
jgi:hypothetical protein